MQSDLLIYGASGYTGRLVATCAVRRGLLPILAGRNAGQLAVTAEALGGLPWRCAALEEPSALDAALTGVRVVLNAAGPFAATVGPVVAACLRAGVHYLDLSGEVDALEAVAQRDGDARERNVMLLPGVGFDVVPSDCLAAHVARRAPGATWLAIGVRGLSHVSRGSYRTLVEQAGQPVRVRRAGALVATAPGAVRRAFDYGDGPRTSLAVSWGDLASAWRTTEIPDVTVYFEATPALTAMLGTGRWLGGLLRSRTARVLLRAQAELLPEGPARAQREAGEAILVAEVGDAGGPLAASRLRTPEVYAFTGEVAAAVAGAVLAGAARPGYHTPAGLLGPDFVSGLAGVERRDIEPVQEEASRWQATDPSVWR